MNSSLIIAIGNDARGDDGLGWEFAGHVADESTDIELRYQLQIEDAELIARYRRVLFVDACVAPCDGGFSIERLLPGDEPGVSSHRLAPETVLALSESLFGRLPESYLLRIDGESFTLGEPISGAARKNLESAVKGWTGWNRRSEFENAFAQDARL